MILNCLEVYVKGNCYFQENDSQLSAKCWQNCRLLPYLWHTHRWCWGINWCHFPSRGSLIPIHQQVLRNPWHSSRHSQRFDRPWWRHRVMYRRRRYWLEDRSTSQWSDPTGHQWYWPCNRPDRLASNHSQHRLFGWWILRRIDRRLLQQGVHTVHDKGLVQDLMNCLMEQH